VVVILCICCLRGKLENTFEINFLISVAFNYECIMAIQHLHLKFGMEMPHNMTQHDIAWELLSFFIIIGSRRWVNCHKHWLLSYSNTFADHGISPITLFVTSFQWWKKGGMRTSLGTELFHCLS
jgi:hypothetical protein